MNYRGYVDYPTPKKKFNPSFLVYMNSIFVGLVGTLVGSIYLAAQSHECWAALLFIVGLNVSCYGIKWGLENS